MDDFPGFEGLVTVSPDSRWLAFTSIRGGEPSGYVRPFPETGRGNWLIAERGSTTPLWSPDDTDLVFFHGPGLFKEA